MKHTPGPWIFHNNDSRPVPPRLIIGQNRNLASIHQGANLKEKLEFDANGRLIAAAPELLAACRLTLLFHAGGEFDRAAWDELTGGGVDATSKALCDFIRNVLARVEGEQKS